MPMSRNPNLLKTAPWAKIALGALATLAVGVGFASGWAIQTGVIVVGFASGWAIHWASQTTAAATEKNVSKTAPWAKIALGALATLAVGVINAPSFFAHGLVLTFNTIASPAIAGGIGAAIGLLGLAATIVVGLGILAISRRIKGSYEVNNASIQELNPHLEEPNEAASLNEEEAEFTHLMTQVAEKLLAQNASLEAATQASVAASVSPSTVVPAVALLQQQLNRAPLITTVAIRHTESEFVGVLNTPGNEAMQVQQGSIITTVTRNGESKTTVRT
jgi:hypothetical protein